MHHLHVLERQQVLTVEQVACVWQVQSRRASEGILEGIQGPIRRREGDIS